MQKSFNSKTPSGNLKFFLQGAPMPPRRFSRQCPITAHWISLYFNCMYYVGLSPARFSFLSSELRYEMKKSIVPSIVQLTLVSALFVAFSHRALQLEHCRAQGLTIFAVHWLDLVKIVSIIFMTQRRSAAVLELLNKLCDAEDEARHSIKFGKDPPEEPNSEKNHVIGRALPFVSLIAIIFKAIWKLSNDLTLSYTTSIAELSLKQAYANVVLKVNNFYSCEPDVLSVEKVPTSVLVLLILLCYGFKLYLIVADSFVIAAVGSYSHEARQVRKKLAQQSRCETHSEQAEVLEQVYSFQDFVTKFNYIGSVPLLVSTSVDNSIYIFQTIPYLAFMDVGISWVGPLMFLVNIFGSLLIAGVSHNSLIEVTRRWLSQHKNLFKGPMSFAALFLISDLDSNRDFSLSLLGFAYLTTNFFVSVLSVTITYTIAYLQFWDSGSHSITGF